MKKYAIWIEDKAGLTNGKWFRSPHALFESIADAERLAELSNCQSDNFYYYQAREYQADYCQSITND